MTSRMPTLPHRNLLQPTDQMNNVKVTSALLRFFQQIQNSKFKNVIMKRQNSERNEQYVIVIHGL